MKIILINKIKNKVKRSALSCESVWEKGNRDELEKVDFWILIPFILFILYKTCKFKNKNKVNKRHTIII